MIYLIAIVLYTIKPLLYCTVVYTYVIVNAIHLYYAYCIVVMTFIVDACVPLCEPLTCRDGLLVPLSHYAAQRPI